MRSALHFFGQAATHFRQTGAVIPSSRRLARALAEAVGEVADGQVIIELGPGSGIVTEALAHRHPGCRLLAVEFNPHFARRLTRQQPGVSVVHGCASALPDHLHSAGINPDQVAAVVSGLPLLSLPNELVRQVLTAVRTVLPQGRRFIQFTYLPYAFRRLDHGGFRAERPRRVWLNVPPAMILPFIRHS
jgi:phosphatidylethanolamine/phosphatidyl-N-methylethanolamine N-methyltransferase